MATRRGPDGSVRVAVTGQYGGIAWANIFWCLLTGGTTATQAGLDAWTAAFASAYQTQWKAYLPNTSSITGCAAVLFQPGSTALHSVDVSTQAGTHSGTAVEDLAASRCLSWATSAYWRGGKPRTYLAGVNSDETDDGKTLNSGAKTALQSGANNFRTTINALTATSITGTQMVLMSFRSGNADRPTPLSFPITGAAVHSRIATQRRRLGPWLN